MMFLTHRFYSVANLFAINRETDSQERADLLATASFMTADTGGNADGRHTCPPRPLASPRIACVDLLAF